MNQSVTTKTQIIQSALELLVSSGLEGLTMRKVASQTGRSLSNVQHHFKNKQVLVCAIVEHYFELCSNLIDEFKTVTTKAKQYDNYEFFLFCLNHFDDHTDACRFFREIWAYALRDPELEAFLVRYQRQTIEQLCCFWSAYPKENALKAAALVLPYFDGYSLHSHSIDLNNHEVALLMSDLVERLLKA
ncbi:TetR/AcrR family transcriptional regulator [Motilimonas sp. 1_MG-2023]|uniref:TetR/AcrR family transcriptional regulator n=1 Tax=Motilimonas sp. 1_MG-2023 TaxID=3062672 RepID=UPI0026E217BF|nr:TetR/AcrR family transcriptional regulator [Motilimonas sp. 1_MG-2023]MDO6525284.1 TetR/AcrR family transcriptional regulator [Motilimonas sp. 1_MG-2023]